MSTFLSKTCWDTWYVRLLYVPLSVEAKHGVLGVNQIKAHTYGHMKQRT